MGLLDKDLEQFTGGSGYKFSATKIDKLGASEYTLVCIDVDTSSSVAPFATQLEQVVKTVVDSCSKSPRKDNLLLRLIQFNDTLTELHGFKLLNSIKKDDYNGILQIGGMTALFDAADESIHATDSYGKTLTDQDFSVNGIIFVITDGQSNSGRIRNADQIKKSLLATRKSEHLQSLLTILIGVTNDDNNLDSYLQTVKDDGGFDQYVSINKSTAGKLAKLAEFVSQSISSTSTALGTGQLSTPLPTTSFSF